MSIVFFFVSDQGHGPTTDRVGLDPIGDRGLAHFTGIGRDIVVRSLIPDPCHIHLCVDLLEGNIILDRNY